jgi:uncharacterized membrane protein YfcA
MNGAQQQPTQPVEQPQVQPISAAVPQGKSVFELLGLKKEQTDRLWKAMKIFMIFIIIFYFMGIILDLFLNQVIFRYVLPLLIVVFLMYKFFSKDIKDMLGKK